LFESTVQMTGGYYS